MQFFSLLLSPTTIIITSNPRRACSQASVGVNRKIYEGLNFPFRGFLGVEKFGRFFFYLLIQVGLLGAFKTIIERLVEVSMYPSHVVLLLK